MLGCIVLIGCAISLGGAIPCQAQPLKKPAADPAIEILNKMQRHYDTTKDYAADFSQVYTRIALSKTTESSGRVMIKKPGKMRWEYKKPAPKLFVADGTKLYMYEPEEQQVIIDSNFKTAELSTSISFLWGEGKLSDSFTPKVIAPESVGAAKDARVLELLPKKDATYSKLVLVLDPKTNQVVESILYETSGNTNRFKFSNPVINKGIKDDQFTFVVPPGVEEINR